MLFLCLEWICRSGLWYTSFNNSHEKSFRMRVNSWQCLIILRWPCVVDRYQNPTINSLTHTHTHTLSGNKAETSIKMHNYNLISLSYIRRERHRLHGSNKVWLESYAQLHKSNLHQGSASILKDGKYCEWNTNTWRSETRLAKLHKTERKKLTVVMHTESNSKV